MSRLCAKPTCSAPSVSWLELVLADRTVLERPRPSPAAFGLCEMHRERFVVPDGWKFLVNQTDAVVEIKAEVTNRGSDQTSETGDGQPEKVDGRQPWFVAAPPEAQAGPFSHPLAAAWTSASDDEIPESAGSLLQRAFHGPDREDDLRRRAEDEEHDRNDGHSAAPEVSELVTRRKESTGVSYHDTELPFPPFDLEHQKAVS